MASDWDVTSHSSRSSSPRSNVRNPQTQSPPHLRLGETNNGDVQTRLAIGRTSPLARRENKMTADQDAAGLRIRKRRKAGRYRSDNPKATAPWRKLLWVKQSYPDNYTDEETFLDHLQRNPRLRPYEFWPLVADSTIIVQHICSVIIFVCAFTTIFQERVSPQKVVGIATFCTVAGWILRDYWQSRLEPVDRTRRRSNELIIDFGDSDSGDATAMGHTNPSFRADFGMPFNESHTTLCAPSSVTQNLVTAIRPSTSGSKEDAIVTDTPEVVARALSDSTLGYSDPALSSSRMQERMTTIKSAVLIYFFLLGLSPILKSLTKSTSSDSIWALSSWLIGINVFTFDYGAGPEAKFPASLSTNAALMASTVLASRLPSTTHVFSLTLFSIEVFGLFPVFRRHLRHHSWTGHLWLTATLVTVSSGGLSMTMTGGGWGMGVLGVVLGTLLTCLSMGLTSWWLIGLQRYKNEIHGPWDPARPILRRHWE